MNPQKVLGIAKPSSVLLVADRSHLVTAFSTGLPYMEPAWGDAHGGQIGLQGSRSAEVSEEVTPSGNGSVEEPLDDSVQQAIADLENINAHLFSIEALMERIFDVRVPETVEKKFKELAGELAPDPLLSLIHI